MGVSVGVSSASTPRLRDSTRRAAFSSSDGSPAQEYTEHQFTMPACARELWRHLPLGGWVCYCMCDVGELFKVHLQIYFTSESHFLMQAAVYPQVVRLNSPANPVPHLSLSTRCWYIKGPIERRAQISPSGTCLQAGYRTSM